LSARGAGRLDLRLGLLGLLVLILLFVLLGSRFGRRDREWVGRAQAVRALALDEVVLPLEPAQVVDRHIELVRDPRVRTTLVHPHTDLVQLGTQGGLSSQSLEFWAVWAVKVNRALAQTTGGLAGRGEGIGSVVDSTGSIGGAGP
jgi:hypothetical protein